MIPNDLHFRKRLLEMNFRRHRDLIEILQIMVIDPHKCLIHIHITVQINIAVGRMIIFRVKIQILLVGEVRYVPRVTPRLDTVLGIREKGIESHALKVIIRRAEHALHFVVNDTVIEERLILSLKLIVPAFLTENLLLPVNVRIEYRVQINVHEVPEIRVVRARYRIHCLVRIGHRVQECVEGTLDELDKGILHRELAGAAKDRVLHDVGNACRIAGRRPECNVEHFVVILCRNQHDPGSALFMAEKPSFRVDILQVLMENEFILSSFNDLIDIHIFSYL